MNYQPTLETAKQKWAPGKLFSSDEVRVLLDIIEADRAAIRLVLEGFDKGIFVRDVSHDHESGWAVRALPYLAALGKLAEIAPTTGTV